MTLNERCIDLHMVHIRAEPVCVRVRGGGAELSVLVAESVSGWVSLPQAIDLLAVPDVVAGNVGGNVIIRLVGPSLPHPCTLMYTHAYATLTLTLTLILIPTLAPTRDRNVEIEAPICTGYRHAENAKVQSAADFWHIPVELWRLGCNILSDSTRNQRQRFEN